MIIIYVLGGILLLYFIISALSYARFNWIKTDGLADSIVPEYTGDQLNLISADALFHRGLFFHTKGFFSEAITSYKKCFEFNAEHSLAKIHLRDAQARKAPTTTVSTPNLPPERSAPERSSATTIEKNIAVAASPPKKPLDTFPVNDVHIEIDTPPAAPPPKTELPSKADSPTGLEEEKTALEFFNKGQTLHKQGIETEAIAEYSKAIQKDPHFIKAYFNRATLLVKNSKVTEALEDFTKLIQLEPRNPLFYYKRANIFQHINELDKAIADYSEALDISPHDANILNRRGTAFFRQKNLDQSNTDFTQAIELKPDFAEAYTNRGIVQDLLGFNALAQEDFSQANNIKQNQGKSAEVSIPSNELPGDIQQILDQGIDSFKSGKDTEARGNFDTVIKAVPANPTAYYHRGEVYLKLKKIEEAIEDFSTAIQYKPDFGEAFSKRGQANISKNLYFDAIDDFTKAIEFIPEHLDSHFFRGRANSQRGQRDDAIADFSKVIALDPTNGDAYYYRAMELQNKGDLQSAMTDLSAACELGHNAACVAFVKI